MNLHCFSLAVLAAALLSAPARADENKDALLLAAKSLKDTPAFRLKMVSTDLETQKVENVTTEVVRPDSSYTRMEQDGAVRGEMVTDGKQMFMRSSKGDPYKEAPANVMAMIKSGRESSSMEALVKAAANIQLLGHETINGAPTTLYQFDSDVQALHYTVKVWISDRDHLPLKTEAVRQGSVTLNGKLGPDTKKHTQTTYEYDPSIKITLPAS